MKFGSIPFLQRPARKSIAEAAKLVAVRYLRLGAPTYPYNVEPVQLAIIVNEMERLQGIAGNILEIGVARGMTTRFMVEYCLTNHLLQEKIYALDTFSSFTNESLQYEIEVRNKNAGELSVFGYNDFEVWKRNFAAFPFVMPIQADCSTFDYRQLAPIKLAFLDVDLYLPTKAALTLLYEHVVKGGVILVHDVEDNQTYDGAYYAFIDFCREQAIEQPTIDHKLGVIRK